MPPEDSTPYEDSNAPDGDTSAGNRPTGEMPLGLRRSDRGGAGLGGSGLGGARRRESGTDESGSGESGASAGSGLSFSANRSGGTTPGIDQLVRQGLQDLERQRRELQREIEQLERRKERLEAEMKTSFAGSSQDIAIRVQGFKDYLIGSLQDLATAAEQINLVAQPVVEAPAPMPVATVPSDEGGGMVPFAAQRFSEQRDRIHSLLDQYRTRPDYYGPPWQLRRTFEPIHAERVSNWFFSQGGRGSVKSVGSRLQNVLVASAAISCLYAIYDRRMCVLVLATTPERLGEWRRWLQDCLGVARADFGTNRGIMLFESSEPMAQRAERLLDSGRLPFLIMDEAEDKVSLSLLQYPLWLGFARDPENPSNDYDYY